MTPAALLLVLALGGPADAQPATDPHVADAARTATLNAAIQRHNDDIAARNAAASAAYAADLARFHAAQAENDQARSAAAAAADAYRRDCAGYEAAMARWRAQRDARAVPPPAPKSTPIARIVCENLPAPGSHLARRVCHEE